MSQPVEKLTNPAIPSPKTWVVEPTRMRKVHTCTFQSESFWPGGRLGAETIVTPQKYPLLKKVHAPGIGLFMQWHDGGEAFIPDANLKCVVYEDERPDSKA